MDYKHVFLGSRDVTLGSTATQRLIGLNVSPDMDMVTARMADHVKVIDVPYWGRAGFHRITFSTGSVTSSSFQLDTGKWVIYYELVLTSKEYMRSNMPLKPEWLTEVAPHFYKKKDLESLGVDKKMPKGQGAVQSRM